MRKTILLVILQQYADWEAAYVSSAISMLGKGNYEIKTVSFSKDYVQSIGGFKVLPDYDAASVPDDYEALILIGGMTWRGENTQPIKALAKDCFQKGRLLGGICDASAFLGTIGILNSVVHTSNDLNDLKQWAGANYTGDANYIAKQAVCNKHVITANGTAPLEFAKEILLALHVADEKTIADWYNFHKLGVYTAPMPDM
ncbi:DJ-1/PfpI family protein [Lachnospiraceae bacterium 48-42]